MTKSLVVRMPDELHDTLKGVSYYTDVSMNTLAVAGIRQYLEGPEHAAVRAIVAEAQERYQGVLDKLKDM